MPRSWSTSCGASSGSTRRDIGTTFTFAVRGETQWRARTAEDEVNPTISKALVDQALDVGEVSGSAQWCGLDRRSYFLSMTAAGSAGQYDTHEGTGS